MSRLITSVPLNRAQSIAPVESVQPTFSTNAAQDQDSMAWRAPGYVSTSASIADAKTLPAVTVHADGTVNVATAYTPAQEAEFQRTYAAAAANQQMTREAEQVNLARVSAGQAAQRLSQRIYDQRQADGRAFVSIVPKALLGAGKDLVNGVDWLGESMWKDAQLQAGFALGEYSGTDGVVGQLLADASTPVTPVFGLDPVERAGSYAFAAINIGDAGLTLAGKAPELISGAGRFFDGLWGGDKVVQTFPELSLGEVGVPNSVAGFDRAAVQQQLIDSLGSNLKANPLRIEYEQKVADLSSYADEIRPDMTQEELYDLATQANQARRQLGVDYKNMTPEPLRDFIYEVNQNRYGDPLGPSIDYFVNEGRTYTDIIRSASRPNPDVDVLLNKFGEWLQQKPDSYIQQHAHLIGQ